MHRYKFDTHVHTSETSPCGIVSACEAVRLYKEAGYQGIVITDHYYDCYFESLGDIRWEEKIDAYLEGYRNAFLEGQKIGINVIPGMEIRFSENFNDYLVYGVDEDFLKNNKELYKLGLRKFSKLVAGKDILIYQAHPFRPAITPADPSLLDGVEVFNGNPRHDSHNSKAAKFAKKNSLKTISGSDFHQIEDLARGGIILPELVNTPGDFVRILMENQVLELISSN